MSECPLKEELEKKIEELEEEIEQLKKALTNHKHSIDEAVYIPYR